jgi:hypothetical protein
MFLSVFDDAIGADKAVADRKSISGSQRAIKKNPHYSANVSSLAKSVTGNLKIYYTERHYHESQIYHRLALFRIRGVRYATNFGGGKLQNRSVSQNVGKRQSR